MKRIIKTIIFTGIVSLLTIACSAKKEPVIDGRNIHHIDDLREAGDYSGKKKEVQNVLIDSIVDPKIEKLLEVSEENKKNQEQTKETLDKIEEIIQEVLSTKEDK